MSYINLSSLNGIFKKVYASNLPNVIPPATFPESKPVIVLENIYPEIQLSDSYGAYYRPKSVEVKHNGIVVDGYFVSRAELEQRFDKDVPNMLLKLRGQSTWGIEMDWSMFEG